MLRHRCYPKAVKVSLYEGNVIEVVEEEKYTKPRANSKKAKSLKMCIDGNTKNELIYITQGGKIFNILTNDIMCGKCKVEFDSNIVAIMNKVDDKPYIIIGTANGIVKKIEVADTNTSRKNGKMCIKLKDDNKVTTATLAADEDDIVFISSDKKAYQCSSTELRAVGLTAIGYKGMGLNPAAFLNSIAIVKDKKYKQAHLGAKGNKL